MKRHAWNYNLSTKPSRHGDQHWSCDCGTAAPSQVAYSRQGHVQEHSQVRQHLVTDSLEDLLEDSLENLSLLMNQKISDIFNDIQRCKSLDLWAIALLMNFVWFLDRLQLHTICPVCNFRKHFEQHHVAALPQVPSRAHPKNVPAIDSEIGAPEVRSSLATPNSNLVSPNYAMILWR
jgi:hypothetical protein